MAYACPLCEGATDQIAIRKLQLEMAECSACRFVFTTEPPANGDLRYGREWFELEYLPSFGVDPANPRTDHLNARFDADLEILERFGRKGRLLDVGAGAGLLLNRAKQRGWEVAGVEPAEYGAEFASKSFGVSVFQGLLSDAPFEPQSFSAIVLQDVIEHVPSPKDLMENVRELLVPGGVALITTPNYASLSRRLYRSNWALISPAEHLSLFRPDTLSSLLDSVGLRTQYLTATNDIVVDRFHLVEQPWRVARRNILQVANQVIPNIVRRRFMLGDELVCVARRPSQ